MSPKTIKGIIAVTRRGTGFVAHEDYKEDIAIDKNDLGTALNGDEVTVMVGKIVRGRLSGRVTGIVERATETFVGTLMREAGAWILIPDDQRCYARFKLINIPPDSRDGLKVVVRLKRWESALVQPIAEVVEVLGYAGEHETETKANIIIHGFSTVFPDEVLKEAERVAQEPISDAEIAKRRDMRDVVTFTIDPDDAKDFDDALSVQKLSDGRYEIGIHIADVTHYVRPGTALDKEARKRGTSVYLVDRTIPMLPETLSNDICSLKPQVDRLAFSAVFVMDTNAHIHERWFGRTIINSNTRFTYKAAQDVLDKGSGTHIEELTTLRDLARLMRKAREKSGAIAFETDEIKIALDDKAKPVRIYVKERLETMKMIEDWMLLANREVPEHIREIAKQSNTGEELPFIYRVHDMPASDRVEGLRIFLKAVGYELGKAGSKVTPKDINTLLATAKGKPEETMIQMATLRSMAKAIYSHVSVGHFSLGFKHYTHFTSPIRRYPDMLAHRLLASHLHGEPLSKEELQSYRAAAVSSSEREVAAAEAERDSIKYKQAEFLENRVGQTFAGTITGVAEHGLYVAEKESRAEGLLRVSQLNDDYYIFDEKHYSLVGERKKKRYRLGDNITVKLGAVDPLHRQIDWTRAD